MGHASQHVGTFGFSVDDGCKLIACLGVVRVDRVTRLKRLGIVIGRSIMMACLLLLTFQIRLKDDEGQWRILKDWGFLSKSSYMAKGFC